MFANLNIYVVIRKYEPTFFYYCRGSKNFSNKRIRADTPHTKYQPLELSYIKIVILPNSNNTVHALLHSLLSIIGF